LALDLLDQRPDRRDRRAPRPSAATRDLRRAGAPRSRRSRACQRRRCRPRLGAQPRQRRWLGERRGRPYIGRCGRPARCVPPVGGGWWQEPMVPPRLFADRDFAFGNATTFLMSGAIFAGGLLVTEEFQLARHYSPVGAGARLLPFFATPMLVSPLAGALSDRIGRRPIIVVGLSMLTAGFVLVAWGSSLHTSWIELVGAAF